MSHTRAQTPASTTQNSKPRTPLMWGTCRAALAASALLSALWGGHAHAEETAPLELTLDEAVATAFRNNPRLRVQAEHVAAAQARRLGAGIYQFNPELDFQAAARRSGGSTAGDFEVKLSQEFELAGQGRNRRGVADSELEAARREQQSAERLLAAEVHLAFIDALEIAERIAVAQAEAELSSQLLDLAQRRLEAGAGTQLDVNVASAELGRSEQAVGALAGDYAVARAVLAESLALPAASLPIPHGELAPTEGPLPSLSELVAAAEINRADLQALHELEHAAQARIRLARAEGKPNLRLGLFAGREGGTDTIVGAGLAIPLPFFQRNQGAVAEAEAAAAQASAEHVAARLSVVREVVTAYELYKAGSESLKTLRGRVLGTTEENLELLRKAFEAGKTGWTDVLVMRRSLFDARRALVETSARTRRARVRIDIATGRIPLPDRPGLEPTP